MSASDSEDVKKERADKKKEFSEKLRSSIQESLENAKEERKRELFMKRVDLAKSGIIAYDNRQLAEATRAFLGYLAIVEDWKKVPEHGLHPRHFEQKEEAAEMLLISGIYWDLAKIYDKAKNKEKEKEFSRYLEKFVLFSKGFPYEVVCRETLRKYLAMGNIKHKAEFEDAYKRLGGGDCFIASALSDDLRPETLYELRSFRDEVLVRTGIGRLSVKIYYRVSPPIAHFLRNGQGHFAQILRSFFTRFLERFVATLTACQFVPGERQNRR